MISLAVILLVAILHVVNANEVVLNQIKQCDFSHQTPQGINRCFYDTIQLIIDENKKVGRSAKAVVMGLYIPEPVNIGSFPVTQNQGEINIEANLDSVNLFGLSNFTLKSAKLDYKKNKLQIVVQASPIQMEGKYVMKGNIILLPIDGGGDFYATGKDASLRFDCRMITNKKNKKYMAIDNDITNIDFKHAEYEFHNLFKSDPILEETLHHFLNTNDEILITAITPILNAKVGEFMRELLNNLFGNIPVNLMYPNGLA